MSNTDEIKRALVNMIAEVTCGESIHGSGLMGKYAVDMFGPYFMVSSEIPLMGTEKEKYYFEIALNEVDKDNVDITENYKP